MNDAVAEGIEVEDVEPEAVLDRELFYEDFYSYMPKPHGYVFVPAPGKLWPAKNVDARLRPKPMLDRNGNPVLEKGKMKFIRPSYWLDKNRPVEGMTWAPGEPTLIIGRLFENSGWIEKEGVQCFNLYQPPVLPEGDPTKAGPWIDHVVKLYGEEGAGHIIDWSAHRKQFPGIKINHALVLGGSPNIGKDTLLDPVLWAVGKYNVADVKPAELFGQWTDHLRSIILRINECHDLGDINRFKFYDHTKIYNAAPPDVLPVNPKFGVKHYVPNVVGVVMTTNYRDALYLEADDRRHYVLFSDLTIKDFPIGYFNKLWDFYYKEDGLAHVATYLAQRDLSHFDPKAPPPKTPAFWAMVDANRATEVKDMSDVIDAMGNPEALTPTDIMHKAQEIEMMEFAYWLNDPKNRKAMRHRLQTCEYVAVPNEDAQDRLWKIRGKRQTVYARAQLSLRDRLIAVRRLTGQ